MYLLNSEFITWQCDYSWARVEVFPDRATNTQTGRWWRRINYDKYFWILSQRVKKATEFLERMVFLDECSFYILEKLTSTTVKYGFWASPSSTESTVTRFLRYLIVCFVWKWSNWFSLGKSKKVTRQSYKRCFISMCCCGFKFANRTRSFSRKVLLFIVLPQHVSNLTKSFYTVAPREPNRLTGIHAGQI